MNSIDKIVLPFKWSEFGSWFSTCNPPGLAGQFGTLAINDLAFTAGNHNLDGIRIEVELCFKPGVAKEVFLCGFLADLEHLQLFEPFVGNPDSDDAIYHACQKIRTHPGVAEVVELFLPEAGWVLPSIWRFLIQSLGLRPKKSIHMPDIIVMALVKDENLPLLFASKPFDYYGNARRLKEELLLEDFFRQLHVDEGTSEAEVQRAYILHCRDSQAFWLRGQHRLISKDKIRSIASGRATSSGQKNSSSAGKAISFFVLQRFQMPATDTRRQSSGTVATGVPGGLAPAVRAMCRGYP